MTGRQTLAGLLVLGCLSTIATQVVAVPPFLSMFQMRSANVGQADLELRDESGPWLILATVISGDDGEQKAIALAKELRQTLGVKAYVHKKVFDSTAPMAVATYNLPDAQKPVELRLRARNQTREEHFAVLVGDFTEHDSHQIQSMLTKVKTAKPQTLAEPTSSKPSEANDTAAMVSKHRSSIWKLTNRKENLERGAMGAALITRNPLLPDEFFQATITDDFVVDLNRDKKIEHSLLDCPGRFTVRVASFVGRSTTDLGSGAEISQLNEESDLLVHAALQAHKMTEALRKKNVEAYEFHDYFGSYVMIGSFNSLGDSKPGGEFQYHPDIIKTLTEYCGLQTMDAKDPSTGRVQRVQSIKSIDKIPFDLEGKAMAVPRPKTSSLYSGSLLGRKRSSR